MQFDYIITLNLKRRDSFMKIVNKVIYIAVVAIIFTFIYITNVNATTTLKVTAETLNLREKASTSSNIVTLLSQGDNCELIEEDGDWYKVKYKTYTGYVSKEYVKQETSSTSNQTTTNTNHQEGKMIVQIIVKNKNKLQLEKYLKQQI